MFSSFKGLHKYQTIRELISPPPSKNSLKFDTKRMKLVKMDRNFRLKYYNSRIAYATIHRSPPLVR